MIRSFLLFLIASLFVQHAYAAQCAIFGADSPKTLLKPMTLEISAAQNQASSIISLPGRVSSDGTQVKCPTTSKVMFVYSNVYPAAKIIDGVWEYQRINEYLAVALRVYTPLGVEMSPSYSNLTINGRSSFIAGSTQLPELAKGTPWRVNDSIELRLMLLKPIMGTLTIPYTRVMNMVVGALDGATGLAGSIYSVYLYGTLSSQQTCQVNLNKTVEFNFHEIRAWDFSDAGVGGRPASAPVQTKSLAIHCNNVDAGALLDLSLTASNTSGNTLVSSNKDIGFIVGNGEEVPLAPDGTSHIPFTLDSASSATVKLSAWPVSVTGHTPAAGEFSAQAFLKLDFQ